MDWTDSLTLWLGFTLFALVILGIGMTIDTLEESGNMRACVEAGRSWVQNNNGYYECR